MTLSSVELFSGAGGLALGLSLAGFRSHAVVEWDKWACDTVRQNQIRGYPLVADWQLFEGDVRDWIRDGIPKLDPSILDGKLDLLAGGPPCQPFSMAGKHRANMDTRDMFPTTVEVIRALRPRAFVVENVRGLTRPAFHNYYQYILLQLEFPDIIRKPGDSWGEHHTKLQAHKTSSRTRSMALTYSVVPTLVNAANYGIPQKRERVFIIGFRSDLSAQWSFPWQTHSQAALLYEQHVSGSYWDKHRVANKSRPALRASDESAVDRMRGLNLAPTHRAWLTVRDALNGIPAAENSTRSVHNHRVQPGARTYAGHTGSPLDQPAKTLKAGDHGVPGGENMMVKDDGSVQYFTVRESARLQTFPDGYVFGGSWSEAMRQLGNAVPVELGRIVAASVAEHLLKCDAANIAKNLSASSAAHARS